MTNYSYLIIISRNCFTQNPSNGILRGKTLEDFPANWDDVLELFRRTTEEKYLASVSDKLSLRVLTKRLEGGGEMEYSLELCLCEKKAASCILYSDYCKLNTVI